MKENIFYMKMIFIGTIVLFLAINIFAQAPDTLWTKTYGGPSSDNGESVQQTFDGGYIMAGSTWSFGLGRDDIYLVKTYANGDTIWTKTIGTDTTDYGHDVQQTSDGGYIVVGETRGLGMGNFDVYLIKTDANGDTLWTNTFGGTSGDEGFAVQQTFDGGYIVAGNTMSFGPSFLNMYIIKTDADGNEDWTNAYGGGFIRYCYDIQQTVPDSGYITIGITQDMGEAPKVCLTKLDTAGNTSWTRRFGTADWYDWAYSVQQTSDGGYIISGFTQSFGAGWYDVYLIKTDANGDSLWTRAYGGAGNEEGYSVQQTQDGGYIVAGYTDSFGAGNNDVYLIRTDANGDTLWTKTCGGTSVDEAYSVQQTAENEYIVVGKTNSYGAGSSDFYLIKLGTPEAAPPAPPVITIGITGDDAMLTWNPVDTTITGDPCNVDLYAVFCSDIPDSLFLEIGTTSDTTYTHSGVVATSTRKFYQVISVVGEPAN